MGETRREKERAEERRVSMREWAQSQDRNFDSAINVPEGYEYFKPKPGIHEIDFMPFMTGYGNPEAEFGFSFCKRMYQLHWLPMPNGKNAPFCALEMFIKLSPHITNPISQWINRLRASGVKLEKRVTDIKAKTRHMWLVNDKPGDPKNKLKLYDTNDWNNGSGFRELMMDAVGESEANEFFYDLKDGLKAVLTVKHMAAGKDFGAHDKVTRISFKPRDYTYPKEMLKTNLCLDDLFLPAMPAALKKKVNGLRANGTRISEILRDFSDAEWRMCYEELRSKGPEVADIPDEPDAVFSQGVDVVEGNDGPEPIQAQPAPKAMPKATADLDSDDDDEPQAAIQVGNLVDHPVHGKSCEVLEMGKSKARIETPTGEEFKVRLEELTLPKPTSATKGAKTSPSNLDDLDNDDDEPKPVAMKAPSLDDDNDDDPPPPSRNGRTASRAAVKAAAEMDEDNLDD